MKKFILLALALLSPLQAYASLRNVPADTVQNSLLVSAPASPITGSAFSYFRDDGFPYFKNSSGAVSGLIYSTSVLPNGSVLLGGGTRAPLNVSPTAESLLLGHTGGLPSFGLLANAHVSPTAALALSKLAPQTVSRSAAFNAAGILEPALTTYDELNRLSGVTSGVQAQLDAKVALAGTQTVTGDKTFTGKTVQSFPSIPDATVATTGNIDALDTSAGSSFRFTGAAPVLRGIANGADGRYIVLINAAGTTISVKNESASATAANRIITGTAADLTLADTASLLAKYDATSSRWRIVGGSGGGGSGAAATAVSNNYTITAHGFAVGDVIYCTAATTCAKAKADADSTSEALGIVTAVPTANTFTLTMLGYVTGLSGLTANTTYYLSASSAGALTSTEPTTVGYISKPMFFADSTTTGYVFQMRGQVVTAATSGGRGKFWMGFHDTDCSWSGAPGSLTDFSDDGSCTFTQQLTSGFSGAVATYGSKKPGLAITAPDTGYIETCVTTNTFTTGANNVSNWDLYDGTSSGSNVSSNGNTVYDIARFCVVTSVTAGNTYNIRIRGWAPVTGSAQINPDGRTHTSWIVKYL